MKKDIVWMDYARVIGISLVVFGHTLQRFPGYEDSEGLKWIWRYIYLFHMPLFFIISGFLFKTALINCKNIRMGGGKIIKVILMPYLFYQLIYFPIAFISSHGYRDFGVCLKLLCGILAGDGYNTPFSMPVCLPCWFIVSIIQLRLLFLFVPINKYTTSLLTLFSCAFLLLRKQCGFDLYFCLDSTIMAIPYFLLGHYMGRYIHVIQNKYILYSASVFCVVMVGAILICNGPAQMNGPSFGNNLFLNYMAGCLGTILVFAVSMLLAARFQKRTVIRDISRNTLFIIFSHWVLLLSVSFLKRTPLPSLCSSSAVLTFMMSIVFTVGILWISKLLIDKLMIKCPILLGKSKR